uniref:Uncharacterized protein n=1 Tax=Faecalibaculum rodentium TaxID=1702221 RepID=A0A140DTM7_9FIRM|nr:hypothetical protein AALO17_08700 [Faecalibaculum rodentium]
MHAAESGESVSMSRRPAVQSAPACMAETEDNPDIRLILRLPVTVKSRFFNLKTILRSKLTIARATKHLLY